MLPITIPAIAPPLRPSLSEDAGEAVDEAAFEDGVEVAVPDGKSGGIEEIVGKVTSEQRPVAFDA